MSGTFTLSVECRLAASHVLPDCPPCDRLHGHTWTVRGHWAFSALNASGMGVNFRTLRKALGELIHDRYDHQHLNEMAPFDAVPPTAENLARESFRILREGIELPAGGALVKVEVWEGPESCVAYTED